MVIFRTKSKAINEDFQVAKPTKSKRPRREALEGLATIGMAAARPYT
jgi:hypothetical protein